ncbi:hypothetical protein B0A48_12146 [Cryoendolithus antarcticus]|uniref:peptidylprolyl isomerase n=1 Tax=Cryoendolithus antarcticus TaxID=1507870 RepID=A0A1V8SUE0_9PEZI|nr:hypothetical protein B0A48_12146 [Cryoendolithus antarcticus]
MTSSRPRVFLDVNIGSEPAGRLTIELFTDQTPKTCENFRQLCTGEHDGLSYAKTPFHRVIDEFMIQGGDIVNGDGTGVKSIYGEDFDDENLGWRDLDAAGLVCSANRGRDTNGCQFFVTLEPCEHLNGKHTVFGRLVGVENVLSKIAKVEVDGSDRPVEPVLVSRCGELERKAKPKAASKPVEQEEHSAKSSASRGRRRSEEEDTEMRGQSPAPRPVMRTRRQSDNVVDEGIRGRPRARSHSRSSSKALHESDEVSDASVTKHKRKRSASPSRGKPVDSAKDSDHMDDSAAEHSDAQRRRRSLPNQYAEQRRDRKQPDGDRYRPSPRRDDGYAGRRYEGRDDRWRRGDRYKPARGGQDGRLGVDPEQENEPPVKYKGRGAMKFREPERL